MAYWVKLEYDRQEYIVDLERVGAFVNSPNGRVSFWLPEAAIPIVLSRQSNPRDYQIIMDYLEQLIKTPSASSWLRLLYDRNEYLVDLDRVSSFCYSPSQKITFWLPDAAVPIILTKQANPDGYSKLRELIIIKTGQSLP